MAKAYKALPPASELWELFDYKPLTGELIWRVTRSNRNPAGGVAGGKSCRIRLDGGLFEVHRIVWMWVKGEEPEDQIDHKDQNHFNNRFWNLRPATNMQNTWNVKGSKGYCKKGRGWAAQIRAGKQIYLGTFDTEAEARVAYEEASKRLHGEFSSV